MKKAFISTLAVSVLLFTLVNATPSSIRNSTPLKDQQMESITGQGWLVCLGVVGMTIAAIVGSAGTMTPVVGALASIGLAAGLICGCASYFDKALGTNYVAACAN
jgi:hypothetical protein